MDIGINFRASSGYVTDGAGETYSLGEVYPVTRGGVTFGWSTALGGASRNRSTAVDRRLAGIVFSSTIGQYFRLDLPSAGDYEIHLAAGDAGSTNKVEWDVNDTTNNVIQIRNSNSNLSGFKDATNATRTAALWPGSELSLTRTFATTELRVVVASTFSAGSNVLAHIRVVGPISTTKIVPIVNHYRKLAAA